MTYIASRRQFLGAANSLAGALLAGCTGVRLAPDRTALGLADITVRRELRQDYAGTLRRLRQIGYTHFGARLAAYSAAEPADPTPADKASMLRDAGLLPGPARLSMNRPLEQDIVGAHQFGASVLAMSAGRIFLNGAKAHTPTRTELDAFIVELDEVGAKVRAAGLRFAYHNHWFDGVPVEGVRPLDLMIERCNPANVSFEIDLAWAHVAGYDVLDLLRRVGPRLTSMHFKDVDSKRSSDFVDQMVVPGEGEMNYAKLAPAIRAMTSALPLVEVDNPVDGIAAAGKAYSVIVNSWKG